MNKCVVACAEKGGWDRFGLKGNKDFPMSPAYSARPARVAGCRAEQLEVVKGLMIACLPQCQVHLRFPASSPRLAFKSLGRKKKKKKKPPKKQQELMYWHIQCTVFCLVMLFIANEENKCGGV